MHRRAFLALVTTSVILPQRWKASATTPEETPATSGRPGPVDLGHGVTLVDYRTFPASPHRRIIGEIRNTTDHMIDAPVVSLFYPVEGKERAGFAYASPMLPVMEAGGTAPIFGTFPDNIDPEAALAATEFALCTPAEPGQYTALEQQLDLTVRRVEEIIAEDVYGFVGELTNQSDDVAADTMVRGIVRDADGRVAGSTVNSFTNDILAGGMVQFSVWAGGTLDHKADPMILLSGTDYTVEIVAGTTGPAITPGCSFGLPWK